MNTDIGFPRQQLSMSKKTEAWRRSCVDWASNRLYFNYAPVRRSVVHMKINYDLLNGILYMKDVANVLNPNEASSLVVPDKIQHYPIMNSKINVLRGEESARVFDWRVVVTNPTSISQIEENKRKEFFEAIRQIVEDTSIDDNEANRQAQETVSFYNASWQDLRERQANELLGHYYKDQGFAAIFNRGFVDAMVCGEEIYQCDIVNGEPMLIRLNPMKMRVFRSGYSNRIEDADVIIYEDYWSPGKVLDYFYDDLSAKDIAKLDSPEWDGAGQPTGAAGNYDDSFGFIPAYAISGEDGVLVKDGLFEQHHSLLHDSLELYDGSFGSQLCPYDAAGNVRVIRVYWKSRRKIKKVKWYDSKTGEEQFGFFPETYKINEELGEEETIFWVNQAWEGTKIADDIYVRMRPRVVQYNTINNPSRCHFGIVGTIYNLNESKPYSLVDMMKSYNYLYDAVHAKLVEQLAVNWGKLLELDLAYKPADWETEKWFHFARVNHVLIKNSFNEITKGPATGKLVAGLNNASKGVVDADWGSNIQFYVTLLEAIKTAMSDLVGISRQREGQISNRETVGGVERATLQSNYITNWLFLEHDDTKRRVLSVFLETARAAMKGRNLKFQYILDDKSLKVLDIDGDDFALSDYGLVVDNSNDTQKLNSQIESLAQAAIQNGILDFATIMRLYSSRSLAEKTRMVEQAESDARERQQQQAQQQLQAQQQIAEMQSRDAQAAVQQRDAQNIRDNETKIKVAEINARAEYLRFGAYEDNDPERETEIQEARTELERDQLREKIRQYDQDFRLKERELDQKREIEMAKIKASKENKNRTKAS